MAESQGAADSAVTIIHLRLVSLISLLSGAFLLGASSVGAIQSYLNSTTAVAVAVQHGQELDKIRGRLSQFETDLIQRTAERWTRTDQLRFEQEAARHETTQDRRLDAIERQVDKLGSE